MKKIPFDLILATLSLAGFCVLGILWVSQVDHDREIVEACMESRLAGKDASEATRQWVWRECALKQSGNHPRPYRRSL